MGKCEDTLNIICIQVFKNKVCSLSFCSNTLSASSPCCSSPESMVPLWPCLFCLSRLRPALRGRSHSPAYKMQKKKYRWRLSLKQLLTMKCFLPSCGLLFPPVPSVPFFRSFLKESFSSINTQFRTILFRHGSPQLFYLCRVYPIFDWSLSLLCSGKKVHTISTQNISYT